MQRYLAVISGSNIILAVISGLRETNTETSQVCSVLFSMSKRSGDFSALAYI